MLFTPILFVAVLSLIRMIRSFSYNNIIIKSNIIKSKYDKNILNLFKSRNLIINNDQYYINSFQTYIGHKTSKTLRSINSNSIKNNENISSKLFDLKDSVFYLNKVLETLKNHLNLSSGGLGDISTIVLETNIYINKTDFTLFPLQYYQMNDFLQCRAIDMINEQNQYVAGLLFTFKSNVKDEYKSKLIPYFYKSVENIGFRAIKSEYNNFIVEFGDISPIDFKLLLLKNSRNHLNYLFKKFKENNNIDNIKDEINIIHPEYDNIINLEKNYDNILSKISYLENMEYMFISNNKS